MKRLLVIMCSLFAAQVAYPQDQQTVWDPNAVVRSVSETYHTIRVSDGIQLFLSQSANEGIAVSANETEQIDNIKTVVENNILKIFFQGDKNWKFKNRKLKAYVAVKDLRQLDASGASDIQISGKLISSAFSMKLSGASEFKGVVEFKKLELDLSGASDVTIAGNVTELIINSRGASDVNGYDLTTETCIANASGASDIDITVNKELSVQASGSSAISFRGEATLKQAEKSGSSSIQRKG